MSEQPDTRVIPPTRPRRWFAPSMATSLAAILVLQGGLFLSQHYHWFSFNQYQGHTVVITAGATLVSLVLLAGGALVGWCFKAKSQFSLATLLLLVAVIAVPCGWLAREAELARQQRAFVARIEAHGERRIYYHGYAPGIFPDFADPRFMEWLTAVFGDDMFAELAEVWADQVTDLDFTVIARLKKLHVLDLRKTSVTDADLAQLRGLTQLRWLYLDETGITDAGLVHLQELPQLDRLYIESTGVTDSGLALLSQCKRLERLHLDGTAVSDEGLIHLTKVPRLNAVRLYNTQVTEAGLDSLKEALPNCEILH
jgi:hypothetical protein